ncbi:MAG: cytochrome c-type biogenesis protein CcmH [Alteromonadaceae bacterium]|uniref:cytochrome c-type biogenesis protein n=1 Tax=unclassified Marinobacter TaxID=83889 RepID=UPI000C3BD832|nr:cytochrome c-type biogenesis protein [Marinobacter sp. BGYM27]MAA63188.1 cytochrome c-type biogenesis protein CcmH [Alteromonadaceae bacterium]MBH84178.1 cytochrome c-type biogenesis protein CcmH [Alteromonadaceae bacterium]MDG5498630.1 cytochrome c-type biogenesis protein CcmH [Marinobacter sp. BGYM27]
MRPLILVILLCVVGTVQASTESYPLASDADRERFQELTKELRCPKCQNQSIADSNAPIASDMREAVHKLVQEGQSNEDIMLAMTSRFGEFVRYRPELDPRTFLLWFTPLIVIVLGLIAVAIVVIRSRRNATSEPVLTEDERSKVDAMLAQVDDPDAPDNGR